MDGVDGWTGRKGGENGQESQDARRGDTEREMRVGEDERMRERKRERGDERHFLDFCLHRACAGRVFVERGFGGSDR